jgi:inward rectifier potassium channel
VYWSTEISRRRRPDKPAANRTPRAISIRQGNFAVSKIGATTFDFREPYYVAVTSSWPVFFMLALTFLLTVVAVFALLFLAAPNSIRGVGPGDFGRSFFFSLEVVSTAGFGVMSPQSLYGYCIAGIERVVGIAILPIVTGILLVRFSRSRAGIILADKAVITDKDGPPELRVRIANCKSVMLTGATAQMAVLLRTHDCQGETWRRYHDLALVRDHLPLFALTWTLMHRIDAQSPLHGLTAADIELGAGRLIVTVGARDSRLGHAVESIADYDCHGIVFGKHYANAVTHRADGLSIADLNRLSLLEDD